MPTQAAYRFRGELERLYRRRTHWLRCIVEGRPPGRAPSLSRARVRNVVATLQDLASDALATKLAKNDFETGTRRRKSWHAKKGKGRGSDAKKRSFNRWFDEHFKPGAYIYVFWRRRQCVYVGKTLRSGRRVSSHFEKHWFAGVTRVDLYSASGGRVLPALECLAIHRFRPSRNKFRAERRKWTRKCGLCLLHRRIDHELRSIFRLR
jgi:hypothetical protein